MSINQRELFPSSSYEYLIEMESGNWWFRSRNKILLWTLKNKVGNFTNLLEIGCGTGFVLEEMKQAFPDAALFGYEYYEEGLVHARRRVPTAFFSKGDVCKMREAGIYNVIAAFDVLEHIVDDEKVLKNLNRALSDGGWLIITVPQHEWLWSIVDQKSCHVRRYTRMDLIKKIQNTGFRLSYITSFVSFLLPIMLLKRHNMKEADYDYDPMREFKIPGWLNKALEKVMDFELRLIKMGVTFPVGGSLLLLARKA